MTPAYYLENFNLLIDTVESLYSDFLVDAETGFIRAFRAESIPAQHLYVRLISRVGPLFRSDKVSYPEIPDIPSAVGELESAGLMSVNGDYDGETVLPMLLKQELLELAPEAAGLRKEEVIAEIRESKTADEIMQYQRSLFDAYEPLGIETVTLLQFLFFGNFRQDLTEFTITNLGIITYENYPLDAGSRAFPDRESINALIHLHNISEELHETLPEMTADEILACAGRLAKVVPDPHRGHQILRRYGRIHNTLGRQLERLGRGDEAAGLYEKSERPPSRERRARIHFAAERYTAALSLCESILADPLNEEEADFAEMFARRVQKKLGKSVEPPPSLEIPTQKAVLEGPAPASVEEYALRGFISDGYKGFYTENGLWNALFSLVFWDIIFLPLEGVFYNPYQSGPADLYTDQFYQRRRDQIDDRIAEVASGAWRVRKILSRYREKEGVSNAFFNWKHVSAKMVRTALKKVPAAHLAGIFARMVRDLRANTSGFPDLIVFPPAGNEEPPYLLVEVKGPGDQLQKNQKRWMKTFAALGVPHRVLWLNRIEE